MSDLGPLEAELELIRDERLREQCRSVLEQSFDEGNWRDPFAAPFIPDLPGGTYGGVQHLIAVTSVAVAVADGLRATLGIDVDLDLVRASALLHDVSKWLEYQPVEDDETRMELSDFGASVPHPAYAAVLTQQHGLPNEVVFAIGAHSPANRVPTSTVLSSIIHHADMVVADSCRLSAGLISRFKVVVDSH